MNNPMKFRLYALPYLIISIDFILCFLLLLNSVSAKSLPNNDFFIDGIIAIVNDEIITISELIREMKWISVYEPKKLQDLSKQAKLEFVLNSQINRKLILQEIKKTQFLSVKKKEIDKRYILIAQHFHSFKRLKQFLNKIHFDNDSFFLYLWSKIMVEKYIQQKIKPRISLIEINNYFKQHIKEFNIKNINVDIKHVENFNEIQKKIKQILLNEKISFQLKQHLISLKRKAKISNYMLTAANQN